MEKKEMPHPSQNTAAGDNWIKGFYYETSKYQSFARTHFSFQIQGDSVIQIPGPILPTRNVTSYSTAAGGLWTIFPTLPIVCPGITTTLGPLNKHLTDKLLVKACRHLLTKDI